MGGLRRVGKGGASACVEKGDKHSKGEWWEIIWGKNGGGRTTTQAGGDGGVFFEYLCVKGGDERMKEMRLHEGGRGFQKKCNDKEICIE
jgi:hypothetical protein